MIEGVERPMCVEYVSQLQLLKGVGGLQGEQALLLLDLHPEQPSGWPPPPQTAEQETSPKSDYKSLEPPTQKETESRLFGNQSMGKTVPEM